MGGWWNQRENDVPLGLELNMGCYKYSTTSPLSMSPSSRMRTAPVIPAMPPATENRPACFLSISFSLQRSTEQMRKVPTIVLSITYKGVKFIDAANKVRPLDPLPFSQGFTERVEKPRWTVEGKEYRNYESISSFLTGDKGRSLFPN